MIKTQTKSQTNTRGENIIISLTRVIIKYLLGVRKTTANDMCLVEIGMSRLAADVKQRQFNLLHKLINATTGDQQDPFMLALHMAKLSRNNDNVLIVQAISEQIWHFGYKHEIWYDYAFGHC